MPSPFGSGGGDGGGGGGGGGNSGGHSPHASAHGQRSIAARLGIVVDDSLIYKAKYLNLVPIATLPNDAAQFRGWKNSFLIKVSSIDKTGQCMIMS